MVTGTIKVLIWGKTYPELSTRYIETVCTGGVREDGSPIRLYPVPLRYLKTGEPYRLYQWIEAPMTKSTRDPRPESYKIDPERIRVVGRIDPDPSWKARRAVMFKHPDWQFENLNQLEDARRESNRSMGVVKPGTIEDVILKKKPPAAEREYQEALLKAHSQQDMFHPEYKELQFLPYTIRLLWRCGSAKCSCLQEPHSHLVLDWGLLELARREGWTKAVEKLRAISDLTRKDFHLFLGNYRFHPWQFGIIGLWYPKLQAQLELEGLLS